jgi:hypothetical protein
MTNTNPTTGIRYGVIAGNSLNTYVLDDLFHGDGAVDLSWQDAMAQLKSEISLEADAFEQELEEEIEDRIRKQMGGEPVFAFREAVDAEFEKIWDKHKGYPDRDSFIDGEFERRSQDIDISEPTIEGEYDGVKYRISWLGGAPLVWVLEGPTGYCRSLCSPCVPNAADLDSGFQDEADPAVQDERAYDWYCYVVPADWLPKEDEE